MEIEPQGLQAQSKLSGQSPGGTCNYGGIHMGVERQDANKAQGCTQWPPSRDQDQGCMQTLQSN